MAMVYAPRESSQVSRIVSTILTLAFAIVLSQKPISAATYLYTFSFTAQDVLTALNVSHAAIEPRLGVFAFFLEPTALPGYTYVSETISNQPADPWSGGTISDANLPNSDTYAYFNKVSQANIQVITTSPAIFANKSYTGAAPSPVFFGGVSEKFATTAVPLSTTFTIVLSSSTINTPIIFNGYASSVTADRVDGFGFGKTDTNLGFNLTLTGVAPEPGTWGLLLGGLGLIIAGSWRRKRPPQQDG